MVGTVAIGTTLNLSSSFGAEAARDGVGTTTGTGAGVSS